MSIRRVNYAGTPAFAESIRQALHEGQEPVLYFIPFFDSPKALRKMQQVQGREKVDKDILLASAVG